MYGIQIFTSHIQYVFHKNAFTMAHADVCVHTYTHIHWNTHAHIMQRKVSPDTKYDMSESKLI